MGSSLAIGAAGMAHLPFTQHLLLMAQATYWRHQAAVGVALLLVVVTATRHVHAGSVISSSKLESCVQDGSMQVSIFLVQMPSLA